MGAGESNFSFDNIVVFVKAGIYRRQHLYTETKVETKPTGSASVKKLKHTQPETDQKS